MIATGSAPRRALAVILALGLAACGDDPAEPTTPEARSEETSGGEETSSDVDDGALPGEVVAAPVDVRNPWEGLVDLGPDPTVVDGASQDAASPFGEAQSERCRRPPRDPMSAAARPSFEAGLAAARAGDLAGARAGLEQALRADPRAADAAYNLGVVADRSGDEARALELYRQALSIVSDHEGAALGTVRIHLRRGSAPAALAFIEPLARAHPRNAYLEALLAETYVAAGRFTEAWSAARRSLACDERFVPALVALVKASRAQGRGELAEAILTQALEVSDTSPELHYLRGVELRTRPGYLREALVELRRAVELRPDYAEARLALGRELLAGGSYAEAVTHLEAAHRLVPGSVEIRLSLADAYRANRRWAEAVAQFEEVIRRAPTLLDAHYDLALMYQAAGAELPGQTEIDTLRKAIAEMEIYQRGVGTPPRRAGAARGGSGAGAAASGESAAHYLQVWRRQLERLEHRRAVEAQEAAQAPAAAPPAGTPPPAPEGGAEAPAAPAAPAPPATDQVEFFD